MRNTRDARSFNEGQARFILIDPALRAGGWNLDDWTQVGFEVPVDGYDAEPWNGVTDYVLHDPSEARLQECGSSTTAPDFLRATEPSRQKSTLQDAAQFFRH